MATFISSVHGNQANQLLKAVKEEHKYIVGCRALGIIDKIVTGPLWRKLQQSSTSIMEIGSFYCQMKEKFDSWSEDASNVINGSALLSDDASIHHDEVWDCLMKPDSNDGLTLEILQLILKAFSVTSYS